MASVKQLAEWFWQSYDGAQSLSVSEVNRRARDLMRQVKANQGTTAGVHHRMATGAQSQALEGRGIRAFGLVVSSDSPISGWRNRTVKQVMMDPQFAKNKGGV